MTAKTETLSLRIFGRDLTISCPPKEKNNLIKAAELLNNELEGIKDKNNATTDLIKKVLLAIKNKRGKKITVEVDNLKQLKKIIGLKFNTILFDNMSIKNIRTGVKLIKKYYETEACLLYTSPSPRD